MQAGVWDNVGSVKIEGRFGELIVAGGIASIGDRSDSLGSLTVGDANGMSDTVDIKAFATLDVAGAVQVGVPAGPGSLTIEDDGVASAQQLIVLDGTLDMLGTWTGGTLDSHAALQTGSMSVETGGFVNAGGTISATNGIIDDSLMQNSGDLHIRGDLTVNGALFIDPGLVAISGSLLGTGALTFVGGVSTLELGHDPNGQCYITGFSSGQSTIEVPDVTSVEYRPNQLFLLSGDTTVGTLDLMGAYSASGFHVAVQGNQGFITYSNPAQHAG